MLVLSLILSIKIKIEKAVSKKSMRKENSASLKLYKKFNSVYTSALIMYTKQDRKGGIPKSKRKQSSDS